jgi:glycyl-tRNA synthetase (class II)
VTIRDRDTMGQVRVSLTSLPTVMEKLMAGQWAEVYRDHGISKE